MTLTDSSLAATHPFVDPGELPPDVGTHSSPPAVASSPGAQQLPDAARRRRFDAVYAEGFPFVFRVLRSLGVHRERLEDAAQDVFAVVHRRLPDFEGRSSLRTWLFGIAQRVASEHRRSERRKSSRWEPLPEGLAHQGASPQARLESQQAADFVDQFVASLSEDKRAVFALSFMEEMPAPEVAQALGIPLNTAYSRIRAVRMLLKEALQRRKLR